MILDSIKSNQEQYSSQSNAKLSQRLFRTKAQPIIHSSLLFQEETVERNSKLLPDLQRDKSNQIRTKLLLIMDSERVKIMSSKCKINSKSMTEVLSQLGSYEIIIENPLERGTPTLFNAKQFHSSKSEFTPSQKGRNNCMSIDDNDTKIDDYSRLVKKIRRKKTISMRKFEKYIESNRSANNNDSIASQERLNSVTPIQILKTKFDLMVKGYEYLSALFVLLRKPKMKKGKWNFVSELNIRNLNINITDNERRKQRANSVKVKQIMDTYLEGQGEGFEENTMTNQTEFMSDNKTNTPTSFYISPFSKKSTMIKYSSFNQSKTLSYKLNTQQTKRTKEKKYSGSVVILFNGEEIEVNDPNEMTPELIEEGVCLLDESKKRKSFKTSRSNQKE